MGFKVTYTPKGGKARDVVTGIESRGRAEEHRDAYAKRAPKGDSVKVEKGGKR